MLRFQQPLQHDATLQTFGVISNAAGANARLVLYKDNAGLPGALVAQTFMSFALVVGAKEQAPDSNASLSAGTTYWLGVLLDTSTSLSGQTDSGQTGEKSSMSFSAAFPSTGPTGGAIAPSQDIGIYISVLDLN
jgi:hypothetical protein